MDGEFNLSSKSWDNLASLCRACASLSNKDRYQKYGKINSIEAVFNNTKKNAPYRKLDFSLTLTDVENLWAFQKGLCAYSGVELTTEPGSTHKVTLDRVDSSLGYELGNVVLCSYRINLMKSDMSLDEFKKLVELVSTHLNKPAETHSPLNCKQPSGELTLSRET